MTTALIETMARAAYESTRTPSFPSWEDVTPTYRAEMRRSITAALKAAEGAGFCLSQSHPIPTPKSAVHQSPCELKGRDLK